MAGVLDCFPWIAERFDDVRTDHDGVYASGECPCKEHRTARVRFWCGDGGQLMFGCYAGCNKLEILRAVGASWAMCYPDGKAPDRPKQEETAWYDYKDERGSLLYQTVRLEPGLRGRDKDFRQRRLRRSADPPGGKWVWNLDGLRRVLYRLPELLAADPTETVFVVAGEKDVESLRRIGLVATTNVCGERSEWLDEYSATLAGRFCCVIPDLDSAGHRHANEVIGSLTEYAASVRRARLPAKDATEFLRLLRVSGVTGDEALRGELWQAIAGSPAWVRE